MLPGCKWGDDEVSVQVIQVPAGQWAESIPDAINQLRTSGTLDAANQKKVDDAAKTLSSGSVDVATACELFSVMVEQAQQEPGLTMTVSYFPTQEDPQAITAQACVDGVYSSVMLVAEDLAVDDVTTAAATAALTHLVQE